MAGLTSSSPVSVPPSNQTIERLTQIERTLENTTNILTIMSQNIKDMNKSIENPPTYEAKTMLGTIVMKPRK